MQRDIVLGCCSAFSVCVLSVLSLYRCTWYPGGWYLISDRCLSAARTFRPPNLRGVRSFPWLTFWNWDALVTCLSNISLSRLPWLLDVVVPALEKALSQVGLSHGLGHGPWLQDVVSQAMGSVKPYLWPGLAWPRSGLAHGSLGLKPEPARH